MTTPPPKKSSSRSDYNQWLDEMTEKVVGCLRNEICNFKNMKPNDMQLEPERYQNWKRRYEALEAYLDMPASRQKKAPPIRKVIRGFLVDFINQTESGHQPLNIEHDKNPVAREYWEKDPDTFRYMATPGIFHAASGFKNIQKNMPPLLNSKPAWYALGQVIRFSAMTFCQEYPKLGTGLKPCASIYNDHMHVIRTATLGIKHMIPDVPGCPDR